jgi:hypothetical protein
MAGSPTEQLRTFIRDLGEMPKDFRRDVRNDIRESTREPLAEARRLSSWSRRIPKATNVRVQLQRSKVAVSLRTSIKRAPHARAYDNKGKFGTFRHPLFGDRNHWITQHARPYLEPAAEPWISTIDERLGEVVSRVAEKYRFHGE